MSLPTFEELLEAGVHFGHQTRRWNPKMRRFILTERNGIHVIDLRKTLAALEVAAEVFKKVSDSGRSVLFVGTKITSRKAIREAAESKGQYYVTKRWLGGMLTNYKTVRESIRRLEKIEQMEREGVFSELQKKEVLELNRERAKLEEVFSGIRHMKGLPGLIFISDIKHEHIAVAEARRLRIPVVAICDTNVDPDQIQYAIPGNDDAVKSVQVIANYLASQLTNAEKFNASVDKKKKESKGSK
jgi:small subunit ribosomal protein S2